MKLKDCFNIDDFRRLAKRRLPSPIFNFIDGGAEDEVTLRRNTEAFNQVDLIPHTLAGMETVDMSTTVLGQQLKTPLFFSPVAIQRLFHQDGELAAARVAAKYGTLFGVSTMSTTSLEDIAAATQGPKLFQLYMHRDQGLNRDLVSRCKEAGYQALALTVDTVVSGNRERDRRTGMTTPPKLTLKSLLSFALHPEWTISYFLGTRFELANVAAYVNQGSDIASSVQDYINNQMHSNISWADAESVRKDWDGPFAIKGILSVEDAKRAVDIGATAIILSNHGGRQLDAARTPFEALTEIVDGVGDRIEVILDGGIKRGSHVLKALALGARACSGGRFYIFPLAAGGERGIEQAMDLIYNEIYRDMMLMGCKSIKDLDRSRIASRL
jgi:L-lactate dehydrogenase (cytochrome)